MDRPELTPADLEEVDRLLHLADSCRIDDIRQDLIHFPEIKRNAVYRAAEILGVGPEKKDDELEEDN